MKKVLKMLSVILAMVLLCVCFAGCSGSEETFGEFSYNGNYLTKFATSDITASEAKAMINGNTVFSKKGGSTISGFSVNTVNPDLYPKIPLSTVEELVNRFASVEITTLYYGEDQEQHTKVDELQGTDFKSILKENEFAPFSQLLTKGIIIFEDIIDYMEECNDAFKDSPDAQLAPFKDIFTYHKDKNGHLVIQTKDFAEIPSSVGGGVGCTYRQDTEILYDGENKISKWQTSLGVSSSTPAGTVKQGYILEISFNWNLKV